MRGKPLTSKALTQYLMLADSTWCSTVHIAQVLYWLSGGYTVTTANGTKLKANKKRTLFHTYEETNER